MGLRKWALHPQLGAETSPDPGWRRVEKGPGSAQPHRRAGPCSHLLANPAAALPPSRGRSALTDLAPWRRPGRGDAVPGNGPAPACAPPAWSPRGGDSGAERGREKREGSAGSRGAGAGPRAPSPRRWTWGAGAQAEAGGPRARRSLAAAGPASRGREAAAQGPGPWGRARAAGPARRRRGAHQVPGAARPPRRKVSPARRHEPRGGRRPWTPLRHGRAPQSGPRSGRLRRGGAHRGAGTRGRRAAGGGAGGRECRFPRPGKLSGGR